MNKTRKIIKWKMYFRVVFIKLKNSEFTLQEEAISYIFSADFKRS